jgi:hypothetical protein
MARHRGHLEPLPIGMADGAPFEFQGEDAAFSEQFEMRNKSARALLLKGVCHYGFIGLLRAAQLLPDLEGNGLGRLSWPSQRIGPGKTKATSPTPSSNYCGSSSFQPSLTAWAWLIGWFCCTITVPSAFTYWWLYWLLPTMVLPVLGSVNCFWSSAPSAPL